MERLRSVLVKEGIGLGEGLDITDKLGSAFLCDSTLTLVKGLMKIPEISQMSLH